MEAVTIEVGNGSFSGTAVRVSARLDHSGVEIWIWMGEESSRRSGEILRLTSGNFGAFQALLAKAQEAAGRLLALQGPQGPPKLPGR